MWCKRCQSQHHPGIIEGWIFTELRSTGAKWIPLSCEHFRMSITPKAIQDLLEELEASKQSRLRAWNVLQKLRSVLSEAGNIAIPPPRQKTFYAEGEALEHALTKSFRIRKEAIKNLCSSVRRFRDATIKEECKAIIHALFRRCGKRWIGRKI